MTVERLQLDDRTFNDLFAEVRSLIPRYASDWTNHNLSDPGIMLLELFAWLTEATLYRINRVSDASLTRLLELLGATFRPAQPAQLAIRVRCENAGKYTLEQGTSVWGRQRPLATRGDFIKPVPFRVAQAVDFTAEEPVRTVLLSQTQAVRRMALARPNTGQPFEMIPIGNAPGTVRGRASYLVPPPELRPQRPSVTVNDDSWRLATALRKNDVDGRRCAYKPWLNAIAFGDGHQAGATPPVGAEIKVTYRGAMEPHRAIVDTFRGTGRAWQVCPLSQPLFELDLRPRHELEPLLEVKDGTGVWEYVSRLDRQGGVLQFTYEPWFNAIRLGSGNATEGDPRKQRYENVLPPEAGLLLTGLMTLGAEGNLPPQSDFGLSASAADAPAGLGQGQAQLIWNEEGWEISTPGAGPTTIEKAREEVRGVLRRPWRTVTEGDFAAVLQDADPHIVRVHCLPDQALLRPKLPGGSLPQQFASERDGEPEPCLASRELTRREGDVSVMLVPDRTFGLTAATRDLDRILAVSPTAHRLLASTAAGSVTLWNLGAGEAVASLDLSHDLSQPTACSFSPDGERLIIEAANGFRFCDARRSLRVLLPTRPGSTLTPNGSDSAGSQAPAHARFSPTGSWWMSLNLGDGPGAALHYTEDGATRLRFPAVERWEQIAFGPGDGQLAAASESGAGVKVCDLTSSRTPLLLPLPTPTAATAVEPKGAAAVACKALAFSADGSTLAASNGEVVRCWRFVLGRPSASVDISLPIPDKHTALLLSPDGTRLLTLDQKGWSASLWSTRHAEGGRQSCAGRCGLRWKPHHSARAQRQRPLAGGCPRRRNGGRLERGHRGAGRQGQSGRPCGRVGF